MSFEHARFSTTMENQREFLFPIISYLCFQCYMCVVYDKCGEGTNYVTWWVVDCRTSLYSCYVSLCVSNKFHKLGLVWHHFILPLTYEILYSCCNEIFLTSPLLFATVQVKRESEATWAFMPSFREVALFLLFIFYMHAIILSVEGSTLETR